MSNRRCPDRLLEIGCGDGRFLELVKSLPRITSVGLDPTPSSAEMCRSKGLCVYAETLSEYVQRRPSELKGFDLVTAFHCLEHVSNPIGLMEEMRGMLAPGGRIYISTPYSPMSFEGAWFDPLNHPPHHMTRWNRRAYEHLAARLGLVPRFIMPPRGVFEEACCRLSEAPNVRPQIARSKARQPSSGGASESCRSGARISAAGTARETRRSHHR